MDAYDAKKLWGLIIMNDTGCIKWLFIAFMLILLSGCASVSKNNTDLEISAKALWGKDSLSLAKRNIELFRQVDGVTVLLPYLTIVNKLNDIQESEACTEENVNAYQQLIKLNPSSLLGLSMLLSCDDNERNKLYYLEQFGAVAQILLEENNGSSIENAVHVREISEADLILATAGYTVLDYEIYPNGERFVYRFHTIDNDSNEFEYHFFDNFHIFSNMFKAVMPEADDKLISQLILGQFKDNNSNISINLLSSQKLRQAEYGKVISMLDKKTNLSAIAKTNLARAYLYSGNTANIEPLIDTLVEQKDLGDINVMAFLAELILELDHDKKNQTYVDELLLDIDSRTRKGNGAFILAQQFKQREKHKLSNYWLEKSLEKGFSKANTLLGNQSGVKPNE